MGLSLIEKEKGVSYPLIILTFFLFNTFSVYAQISPGDLTGAHAKLEGISNCTKCHVLGKKVSEDKCLNCHKKIAGLINTAKGYHSSKEVNDKKCWNCHSEHFGRNFKIIKFDPDNFDHSKTKYILKGKHSDLKCGECHRPKFINNTDLKKRKSTYLGLSEKCISCHNDYHKGALGDDCSSCHNFTKFRPAPGFNHDKAKFKLTGAHLKVKCIECHPEEKKSGTEFQKFTGLKFNQCSACHKDVHNGKFGTDCSSCHITDSFKKVDENKFNHNLTDFPLKGKHMSVHCRECHKTGTKKISNYSECKDCHTDYHKGDFTAEGKIKDCADCHSVQGFSSTSFTINEHNKGAFVLKGSHLAVSCKSCHYKNGSWHFKNIGVKCNDCHLNVHGGELTAKFMPGNNCTVCHSADSWDKISFNHDKTGFKLLGKHVSVSCGKCHLYNNGAGNKTYRFASLKSNCVECHKDIHFGQFKIGNESDCLKCHSFNNWKADKFDHSKTAFTLKGAHAKVKCFKCHKKVEENGNSFIKYKIEDFKCAACHS